MTFEEKLEFIRDNINDMKSNLGIPVSSTLVNTKAEVIDIKETVDEIINSPSLSLGIYKVASIAERDALNAVEGDICLVYGTQDRTISQNDTELTTITLPETVVLKSQISGSANLRLRPSEGWEPEVQLFSSENEIYVSIRTGSEYYDFTYTSQDGLNFTISGNYPENRTFTTETPIGTDPNTWEQYNSEPLTPFIHVTGVDFGGLYNSTKVTIPALSIPLNKYLYKDSILNDFYGFGFYLYNIQYTTITNTKTSQSYDIITECDAVLFSSLNYLRPDEGSSVEGRIDSEGFKYTKNATSSYGNASIRHFIYDPSKSPYEMWAKIKDIDCPNGVETLLVPISDISQNDILFFEYDYSVNPTQILHDFKIYNSDKSEVLKTAESMQSVSLDLGLEWKYLDIGISVDPIVLLEGNTVYTSRGNIGGIFYSNNSGGSTIRQMEKYLQGTSQYLENITDLSGAFMGFNNTNNLYMLQYLNTSNVTNMSNMFYGCMLVTNITGIDTSNCINASSMFSGCYNLRTLSNIDTSNITNFSFMFNFCRNINQIPNINTSNGVNMLRMFYACENLQSIPNMDTSNVIDMREMLTFCRNLQSIPNMNTPKVKNMSGLFFGVTNLLTIPNMNTSNVSNMRQMFYNCFNLQSIPNIDTSNVVDMSDMFHNCFNIQSIPNMNTSKVENMYGTFWTDSKLSTAPSMDLSNVTDTIYMSMNCTSLKNVPVYNCPNVISGNGMFYNCPNLTNASISNLFNTCISMVNYPKKTLSNLGFNSTSYPASRIQAQPGYSDFINAGWNIGY